jgi:hypothetical protein
MLRKPKRQGAPKPGTLAITHLLVPKERSSDIHTYVIDITEYLPTNAVLLMVAYQSIMVCSILLLKYLVTAQAKDFKTAYCLKIVA